KLVTQINGCYEHQWYDACSVMVRKLVENLIILAYEGRKQAHEIKNNGEFLMLNGLITHILTKAAWNLGRDTKKSLPDVKELAECFLYKVLEELRATGVFAGVTWQTDEFPRAGASVHDPPGPRLPRRQP